MAVALGTSPAARSTIAEAAAWVTPEVAAGYSVSSCLGRKAKISTPAATTIVMTAYPQFGYKRGDSISQTGSSVRPEIFRSVAVAAEASTGSRMGGGTALSSRSIACMATAAHMN